jgi:hypothetical protein
VKRVAESSKKTVLIIYSGEPIDISEYVNDIDVLVHASSLGQEKEYGEGVWVKDAGDGY